MDERESVNSRGGEILRWVIIPILEEEDYYDMVEFPSGHVPVPLLFKPWKIFPILKGEQRTDTFYRCRICGEESFYQSPFQICERCKEYVEYHWRSDFSYLRDAREILMVLYMTIKLNASRKRETKRFLRKKIEHMLFPVLWLFGQVRYNKSYRVKERYSHYDYWEYDDEEEEDIYQTNLDRWELEVYH